ncbi:transketolase family protein [SAR202 cluster bacterium AD-493-K16_JPT_193m]|nr:transketolase family protein [SAR202 cluster bacterium AD-493-K16_JPT_193m]
MTTAATRESFGKALLELGQQNPDIVVVGGDLNVSTFAHLFAKEFPDRFFDLGPAEQNMMSIAAGLAASGKIPFVSTFAVFGTGRPYDQIRINIAQMKSNVKIVCTHAGLTTGEDGISAQSIEDIALMCALPGFNVIVPSDGPETESVVKLAAETSGPFYIRLSRPATEVIHETPPKFLLGKAEELRSGSDLSIIACGVMVSASLMAATELSKEGIEAAVINMPTLQPLDEEAVLRASRTGAIVTAEEHYIHGGLGSLVSQSAARQGPVPIEMVATTRYAESGKPDELLAKYGLSSKDIVDASKRVVERKAH